MLVMSVVKFLKRNIVLAVSFVLAVVSMFFVAPSQAYIDYIDFRTLALLFCLMCVVAGLNGQGVFHRLASLLVRKTGGTRSVSLTLILLCFFTSMFITNDVALITFVPFTILTFRLCNCGGNILTVVVLETVSANLGSMATPIGNPQNLYLYNFYDMRLPEFLQAVLPYAALSLVLLVASVLFVHPMQMRLSAMEMPQGNKVKVVIYVVLFVVVLLSVARVLNVVWAFAAALIVTALTDRHTLTKIDYSLLLTFVCLFVFIGNLGHIDVISNYLKSVVQGNEILVGILASQVFSNVPSAVLLSGFTSDAVALVTAVNLGGLGTLIASMASIISFNAINDAEISKGRYLLIFTAVNVIFLFANILLYIIICIV